MNMLSTTERDSLTAISHQSCDTEGLRKGIDNKDVELTDQTNLLPFRKILVVYLGLASCIVVTSLDSTIVATALPTISAAFNAGAVSSWVASASLLTSTAFQPLYGRFSDIFGRKATLCVAMGLFVIGSLGAGLSRSMVELVIFRGVSGAGGGGVITLGQVVVSDVVSLRDRGKYQGIIGGVNTFGYAVGPVIGGVLAQKVSWRWCFWITIPVSVVATAVVLFIIPLKPVKGDIRRKLLVVDYMGAGLTLAGCTLLLLPIIWGGVTFPWNSLRVIGSLMCGFSIMVIFCLWEWKGASLPIVPMHIFRYTTVVGVYITMFIFGFIYWSSLYYIPQFSQVVLGFSPVRSGIFLLPILVSQTTTSFLAGLAVSRTGKYRTIVYCGFTIWSIGLGCLSTITPTKPRAELVIFMILCGIGSGQTQQTTIVAAQASVPRSEMSVVTAVRNFLRFIGGSLSLAVGSSIINNSLISAARAAGVSSEIQRQITQDPTLLSRTGPGALNITATVRAEILHGYTSGFRAVFILNASLAAISVVVAYLMIQHKDLTRDDDAQRKANALQEVELEVNIARKKGKDEERIECIVPASVATLRPPAPIHLGKAGMWFANSQGIDSEESFCAVLPESTATLAVDDVEGKELRFARTRGLSRERTRTIMPDRTGTLTEGRQMRPTRTQHITKGKISTTVPDSTAALAIYDGEKTPSTRTKQTADGWFRPVVPDSLTYMAAYDGEDTSSIRTQRMAEDRIIAIVPNSTATLAIGNTDETRLQYAIRTNDRFSTNLRRESTTTLPVGEANFEKDDIGYYHS